MKISYNPKHFIRIPLIASLICVHFQTSALAAAGTSPRPRAQSPEHMVVYTTDANGQTEGTMRLIRSADGSFINFEVCDARLERVCSLLLQTPQEQAEFQVFMDSLKNQLAERGGLLKQQLPTRILYALGNYTASNFVWLAGFVAIGLGLQFMAAKARYRAATGSEARVVFSSMGFLRETLRSTVSTFLSPGFLAFFAAFGLWEISNQMDLYHSERTKLEGLGQTLDLSARSSPIHLDAAEWTQMMTLIRQAAMEARQKLEEGGSTQATAPVLPAVL